ncbi:E2/UBC family protein [Haloarcula regularis]|uniref:E2/UBC family protein n=1 Tax=Haloarcula regularis TaxID=3033392 RepID=UPI0023E87DAD|nr:E2/UBC family protein [Halomicroarcula sp. SYNS111]
MQPTDLEEATQHAQDRYRGLNAQLESLDEGTADDLRAALEAAEDAIDESQDTDENQSRYDALHRAADYIQSAQDDIDTLQDAAGFDVSYAEELEALEEAIEEVEDGLDEALEDVDEGDGDEDDEETDGYEVTVSGETKVLDQQYIEPIELLRTFEYDPNQYVLYPPDEDDRVPKDSDINLAEENVFDAIPVDTAYGSTQLDDVLAADIEVLRENHEVDVDTEAEAQFVHVTVRDYQIPSDAYSADTTDVMIRVHENYPQKAPDWVYVDEDLRLEGGGELSEISRRPSPGLVGSFLAHQQTGRYRVGTLRDRSRVVSGDRRERTTPTG